jgi:hypothetical protein
MTDTMKCVEEYGECHTDDGYDDKTCCDGATCVLMDEYGDTIKQCVRDDGYEDASENMKNAILMEATTIVVMELLAFWVHTGPLISASLMMNTTSHKRDRWR